MTELLSIGNLLCSGAIGASSFFCLSFAAFTNHQVRRTLISPDCNKQNERLLLINYKGRRKGSIWKVISGVWMPDQRRGFFILRRVSSPTVGQLEFLETSIARIGQQRIIMWRFSRLSFSFPACPGLWLKFDSHFISIGFDFYQLSHLQIAERHQSSPVE